MERNIWPRPAFLRLYEVGKDLEVRTRCAPMNKIEVGDILRIGGPPGKMKRRVKRVAVYPTFVAMLDVEDPARITPGATRDHVLAELKITYTPYKELRGVLIFELEPI